MHLKSLLLFFLSAFLFLLSVFPQNTNMGNSSIYVEYANFAGQNTFLNRSGKIEVIMPYDKNPPMWVRWDRWRDSSPSQELILQG